MGCTVVAANASKLQQCHRCHFSLVMLHLHLQDERLAAEAGAAGLVGAVLAVLRRCKSAGCAAALAHCLQQLCASQSSCARAVDAGVWQHAASICMLTHRCPLDSSSMPQ